MNINKAVATAKDTATGIYMAAVFIPTIVVKSVPVVAANIGQSITNKIFG